MQLYTLWLAVLCFYQNIFPSMQIYYCTYSVTCMNKTCMHAVTTHVDVEQFNMHIYDSFIAIVKVLRCVKLLTANFNALYIACITLVDQLCNWTCEHFNRF